MLNLRTQVLKRNTIISSRRLSARMQGDQYHLSSIYEYSLGKPPPTSRATESGWSAFETSFVGNLGEPIVTFEHEHELDENSSTHCSIADPIVVELLVSAALTLLWVPWV